MKWHGKITKYTHILCAAWPQQSIEVKQKYCCIGLTGFWNKFRAVFYFPFRNMTYSLSQRNHKMTDLGITLVVNAIIGDGVCVKNKIKYVAVFGLLLVFINICEKSMSKTRMGLHLEPFFKYHHGNSCSSRKKMVIHKIIIKWILLVSAYRDYYISTDWLLCAIDL